MNESDALTKWCPMGRFPYWPNECSDGNEGITCIASGCMMWREIKESKTEYAYSKKEITAAEVDGWKVTGQKPMDPEYTFERVIGGYCGLAGKP